MDLLRPTDFFLPKVVIIITKSATIAFFSSPPFLLLALSLSPFLAFSFVTVILELLGLKKPVPFDAFSLG